MAPSGDQSFIRKLIQLFKTVKKPPPADKGDQKYASEETPDALKAGIIKELVVQQHSIPEDIDILVEIIKVAQAGGYKFDIKQVPDMVLQRSPLEKQSFGLFGGMGWLTLGLSTRQVDRIASAEWLDSGEFDCAVGKVGVGFAWTSTYLVLGG